MEVIKRNGNRESMSFDKITKRISNMIEGNMGDGIKIEPLQGTGTYKIDPIVVAKEVINGIYTGITTAQIDDLSADVCASMIHKNPDYNHLASRIRISNLQKQTHPCILDVTIRIAPQLHTDYVAFVSKYHRELNEMLHFNRDFGFDYFGFRTLERSYLLNIKSDGKQTIVERPQHMWMRVAVQIHGMKMFHPMYSTESIQKVLRDIEETYNLLSTMKFTHATPTLFNSGTKRQQMSSCFLTNIEDDITSIFKTISNIAHISKFAGGIGLSITPIRAKGSLIRTTNGLSEGIIPMCKVIESTARYINQGGKRLGSVAVYLEPWHADVFDFVELRKNTGDENLRCRDLFLALWIPDEFMRRVERDDDWYLMCPDKQPGLVDAYGSAFEQLYNQYISEGNYMRKVRARDLWNHILEAQIETGMPYISYKDHVNKKNNQSNLGTIRNSNLCVAGYTRVLTDKGYVEIKDIVDVPTNVWNGWDWSTVMPRKTGSSVKTVEVELKNGQKLHTTPEHKFYTSKTFMDEEVEVKASDLKPGDRLASCLYPIIRSPNDTRVTPMMEIIATNSGKINPDTPPLNSPLIYKIRWLEGAIENPRNYELNCQGRKDVIILSANSYNTALNIRLMLTTMGCNPEIINTPDDVFKYKIHIGINDIYTLKCEGFSPRIVTDEDVRLSTYQLEVKSVGEGPIVDTFCFTEPLRHRAVFDGVYTGQCNEIVEYSSPSETAVCNLASICLPRFVNTHNRSFNFEELARVVRVAIKNLNTIIDLNYYPIPETERSNNMHRPVGLGIQGLADVYIKMRLPFESEEANSLNKEIMETIYYNALKESCELSIKYGPYDSFNGSPASNGILQWHMWDVQKSDSHWTHLIEKIKTHGLRNSLLVALMPTASTSQICGNTESFEPITSNIYVRKTLAGEFIVVNEHLVRDLMDLGIWSRDMYNTILYLNGSVQAIESIPRDIRELYKTAFEIKQSSILKQAATRGPYVDQTQSMNLFMGSPDFGKLTSMHFYGWKSGLKTGMYYLRTQPAVDPIKFGLDPATVKSLNAQFKGISLSPTNRKETEEQVKACPRRKKGDPIPEGCDVCSA